MVTHLFNAQRGIHHREPGVAGQALADPRLASSLILDGHHVVDAVARVAFAAAAGRIALITDAIAATGMEPGMYELGGEPVIVRPGRPPSRPDGTLAGANLRLDDAVARAVAIGVPPRGRRRRGEPRAGRSAAPPGPRPARGRAPRPTSCGSTTGSAPVPRGWAASCSTTSWA